MSTPSVNTPPDTTRIGHFLGPHGVQGAIKLYVLGSAEQLRPLKRLYIEGLGWLRVTRLEVHQAGVAVQLAGITERNMALELRGKQVYAHDQELPPLPEDEYYYHELRGLKVLSNGETLGEVSDVLDMGHQDVLVVRHAGGESLIPLQAPYVQVKRRVAIILTQDAPVGLLGENAPDKSEQPTQP